MIVVTYSSMNAERVVTFILPMETIVEAKFYIETKIKYIQSIDPCKLDYYECDLDNYRMADNSKIFFINFITMDVDDFHFETLENYIKKLTLVEVEKEG